MFNLYWALLIISGILMLGLSISGFGGAGTGTRVLNAVLGAAFVGYGVYLALFYTGGWYLILFKAFIVPVVLIVQAVRSAKTNSANRAQQQNIGAPQQWQPTPQWQPGAPTSWTAPAQPATITWAAPNSAPPAQPTLSSDDVLGR